MFGFEDSPGVGLRAEPTSVPDIDGDIAGSTTGGEDVAILGGGCFWCVDGIYRQLDGVTDVVSGYAGGPAETANYEAVCRGNSGHAEVVKIHFDPSRITYGGILKIFFAIAHDPTQLNRQGNDVGTQYRSAIFHNDEAQRDVAERYVRQLEEADVFTAPIVTELAPLDIFHEAEPYHQNYAARNPAQPYISCISAPKIQKLRKYFPGMLKGQGVA